MKEVMILLTWKKIIKHYIEDLIFETSKKLNFLNFFKNWSKITKKISKKCFYYLNIKYFRFFWSKFPKKIFVPLSLVCYGITQLAHTNNKQLTNLINISKCFPQKYSWQQNFQTLLTLQIISNVICPHHESKYPKSVY